MTIRKILATLLALSMTLSLAACGGNSTQTDTAAPSEQTEQTEEAPTESDESAAENTETETPSDETEASEPAEKVDINLAALSGPTALGMLDLLEKNDNGEAANNYNVTIATAPDEVTGKIISGELDIAAVPTNVASTLYNKTEGQLQIAALNTMGVLYVLETGDTIQSVADLAGKTIYATGQGSTPEYALNLVLEKNGLTPGEDVEIVFAADNAEIAPLLASGEAQVALLPQPFVTSVLTQNENVRVALDLTEEWDKAVNGESGLTMGCVVVRKEFAEQNKEALDCQANGERFSEFIGRELPEKMRALFPLSEKREDTFIGGLSMGGYGAITNGLKYSETFGRIAGLSSGLILDRLESAEPELTERVFGPDFKKTIFGDPIIGSDKDYHALAKRLADSEKPLPEIYLCCGTEDDLLEANRAYARELKDLGYPVSYDEGPGGHDWEFWNTYIKKVVDWLPLEKTESIHSGHVQN